MNRNDWGNLVLGIIIDLLLKYAAKHTHDAAQDLVSRASLALAADDPINKSAVTRQWQSLLPMESRILVGSSDQLIDPKSVRSDDLLGSNFQVVNEKDAYRAQQRARLGFSDAGDSRFPTVSPVDPAVVGGKRDGPF